MTSWPIFTNTRVLLCIVQDELGGLTADTKPKHKSGWEKKLDFLLDLRSSVCALSGILDAGQRLRLLHILQLAPGGKGDSK